MTYCNKHSTNNCLQCPIERIERILLRIEKIIEPKPVIPTVWELLVLRIKRKLGW